MGAAIDHAGPVTAREPSTLAVTALHKHFGRVRANDGIDVTFRGGEVHALLGENGAGKSTLIKCLTGVYRPDSGRVEVDGREVSIRDPADSRECGIAVVHQSSTLISRLTLLENVVLQEGRLGRIPSELADRLVESGSRLGFSIDPRARVERLSVGDLQRAEIARAFMQEAWLVILDEPTAVLAPAERASLFDLFGSLTAQGVGVVFVTHHLAEALSESSRTTVLRAGQVVGRLESGHQVDERELVRLIVGDDAPHPSVVGDVGGGPRGVSDALPDGEAAAGDGETGDGAVDAGEVRVEVRRVSGAPLWGRALHEVDLTIRRGEVLGVAGVEGNGQRELSALLAGSWSPDSGSVLLDGTPLADYPPPERSKLVGDVPDDHFLATCGELSVWENLALGTFAWQEAPTPGRKALRRRSAADLVREFDIRTAGVGAAVRQLSGGNRRRVILARELSKHPALLVATYPTRGLDVRSAEQVRAWVRRLAEGGSSVVYMSTELEEIIEVSDRVAVMVRGRITGVLSEAITIGGIGNLMLQER